VAATSPGCGKNETVSGKMMAERQSSVFGAPNRLARVVSGCMGIQMMVAGKRRHSALPMLMYQNMHCASVLERYRFRLTLI
jgi:hypothetical protein